MPHPFDADELFGEDYLHFYGQVLGDDRSDEDTDTAVAFAHLAPGMHVLDAPCGHGRMAVRMAERGLTVTGVDLVAHFLDRAREEAERRGVEVDGDLMVDRNEFDAVTGSIVCHRVTVRDGVRREARFAIRLPTVPEWYRLMADAGFASVEVTDREGAPVDLATWRVVVTAVA